MRYIIALLFVLFIISNIQSQDSSEVYIKEMSNSDSISYYLLRNTRHSVDTRHYKNNLSKYLGYGLLGLNQHTLAYGMSDDFETTYFVAYFNLASITYINDDYFNDNRYNFSIPLSTIASLCGIKPSFKWGTTIEEYILMMLNSQYHFYLYSEQFTKEKQRPQWISIFLKHNVEWYAFRTHQWVDFSPGLGVGFHLIDKHGNILDAKARLSIEFGYTWEIATNFVEPKYFNKLYINLRLNGPIVR